MPTQTITSLSQLDLDTVYSYADYLLWRLDERVELIRGKLAKMSPAPNRRHQEIITNLFGLFLNKMAIGAHCKIYTAPFDVRLVKNPLGKLDNEVYTVVQPDLSIICDKAKLDERGCLGAPDLIIEILSKGNSKQDLKTKYELYQENGVKEYWIIFPHEEVLQQYVLADDHQYHLHQTYPGDGPVQAFLFPDLQIELEGIFAE